MIEILDSYSNAIKILKVLSNIKIFINQINVNPYTVEGITQSYLEVYGELPSDELLQQLVALAAQEMMFGGSENLEAACRLVVEQYGAGTQEDEIVIDAPEGESGQEQNNNNGDSHIIAAAQSSRPTGNTGGGGSGNSGGGTQTDAEATELRNKIVNNLNGMLRSGNKIVKQIVKGEPYSTIFSNSNLKQMSLGQLKAAYNLLTSKSSTPIKISLNSSGTSTVTVQPLRSLYNQSGRQTVVTDLDKEKEFGSYPIYKKLHPNATLRDYVEAVGRHRVFGSTEKTVAPGVVERVPNTFTTCNVMALTAVMWGQVSTPISEEMRLDFAKWSRYQGLVGASGYLSDKEKKDSKDYNKRIHGTEDHKLINDAMNIIRENEKRKLNGEAVKPLSIEQERRLKEVFPLYTKDKTKFISAIVEGHPIQDARGRELVTTIGENEYPQINSAGERNLNDINKGMTYYYNPGVLENVRDGIVDYAKQWSQKTGINLPELPIGIKPNPQSYSQIFNTLNKADNNMSNYVILINNIHYVKVVGVTNTGQIIIKDSNVTPEIHILEAGTPEKPIKFDIFNYTPVNH